MTHDDKRRLFLYFFFISQVKKKVGYKSKNALYNDFEAFLERSALQNSFQVKGGFSKKYFEDSLKELEERRYLEIVGTRPKRPILTPEGEKTSIFFTHGIDFSWKRKVHIHFNLSFSEEQVVENRSSQVKRPFPELNTPYSETNFYWYFRKDKLVDDIDQFKKRLLKSNSKIGLIWGDSNSGKTSLVNLIVALNSKRRTFPRSSWVEDNKVQLQFPSSFSVKLIKSVFSWSDLQERVYALISPLRKQNDDRTKKETQTFEDRTNRTAIEILDHHLCHLNNRKYLLFIDQCEPLIEDLLRVPKRCKNFGKTFYEKVTKAKCIFVCFVVSSEYLSKFKEIIDTIRFEYENAPIERRIPNLEIDLMDDILDSLRLDPDQESLYQSIIFTKNQIQTVKEAINRNGRFFGTYLSIILHQIVKEFGRDNDEEINLPDSFNLELCKSFIETWLIEKIEKRSIGKSSDDRLEFSLLTKLYLKSQTFIAPLKSEELNQWYEYECRLIQSSCPSLAEILRNLAQDGLIDYDKDSHSCQIRHKFVLDRLNKYISIEKRKLMEIENEWKSHIAVEKTPTLRIFDRFVNHLQALIFLLKDEASRKALARGCLQHSEQNSKNILKLPEEILKTILSEVLYITKEEKPELTEVVNLFNLMKKQQNEILTQLLDDRSLFPILADWPWHTWMMKGSGKFLAQLIDIIYIANHDLGEAIFNHITKVLVGDFAQWFSHIEMYHLLDNLMIPTDKFHRVISTINWSESQFYGLPFLIEFLQVLRTVNNSKIKEYETTLEKHMRNLHDEKKVVKAIFSYHLYQTLKVKVDWKNIKWIKYKFSTIVQFFASFDIHYLPLPKDLLNADWSSILRFFWQNQPDLLLMFIYKEYSLFNEYIKGWPKNGSFPTINDFIDQKKLGLFNYFVKEMLIARSTHKEKAYDFLSLKTITCASFSPLLETAYHKEIVDFIDLFQELALQTTLIKEIKSSFLNDKPYINRYHETFAKAFKRIPSVNCKLADSLLAHSSEFDQPARYWDFHWLPSLLDLSLLLNELKSSQSDSNDKVKVIIRSINQEPKYWNQLLSVDFYIQSLRDFYPGTERSCFLQCESPYGNVSEAFIKFLTEYKRLEIENGVSQDSLSGKVINSLENVPPKFRQDLLTPRNYSLSFYQMLFLHQRSLFMLFSILAQNLSFHGVLSALVEKTDFLKFLNNEKLITKQADKHFLDSFNIIWKPIRLFTNDSDEKIKKLDSYISRPPYHLERSFLSLLKADHSQVSLIWRSCRKLLETYSRMKFSEANCRAYPTESTQVLIKILQVPPDPLTEAEKIWKVVFGLNNQSDALTSLNVNMTTLEMIDEHPNRQKIIHHIPWDVHLPRMSENDLEKLYEKDTLFHRRGSAELCFSFSKGLLEVFTRWFNLSQVKESPLGHWCNLFYVASLMKNRSVQNKWLQKTVKELSQIDFDDLIRTSIQFWQEQRERYQIVQDLRFYIESLSDFQQGYSFVKKLLQIVFSNTEFFHEHCYTFRELNVIAEKVKFLTEKDEQCFHELSDAFTKQASRHDYYLIEMKKESYFPSSGIYQVINSRAFQKLQMQQLIFEKGFFKQTAIAFNHHDEPRIFDDLNRFYSALLQHKWQKVLDVKKFIQKSLESIKVVYGQRNDRYDQISWQLIHSASSFNPEFLELLVTTNLIKNLNWKEILEEDAGRKILFIDDLSKIPLLLQRSILENPYFWDVNWYQYLKKIMVHREKRLLLFFELLDRAAPRSLSRQFIEDQHFDQLPWRSCQERVKKKDSHNLLTREDYQRVREIITQFQVTDS